MNAGNFHYAISQKCIMCYYREFFTIAAAAAVQKAGST